MFVSKVSDMTHGLLFNFTLFYFPETNDQTAVVAGGVGGTLALVILILIIVFLVHRRYTCICSIGKVFYVMPYDIVPFKKKST